MFAVETALGLSVNRSSLSDSPPVDAPVFTACTASLTSASIAAWLLPADEIETTSGTATRYGIICANNPVNFTDPTGLWAEELAFWNPNSAVGRQFVSIGDAFGSTLARPFYPEQARNVWNEAVNNSGQAILDEECAGKGARTAYWGALGISAAADLTAGGLIIAGVDPWMGKIAYHAAHAGGPHQFPHIQIMLRTGQSITRHLRIPLPW